MTAVVARPKCDRRFGPKAPGQTASPCDHTALWSALLHCTSHDGTAVQNLCARCSVIAHTKGFKCGPCKTRSVVIVALLRLDGVDR